MTGKEALEKLLDALKYCQGRNTIFDKIHSKHILDELELLEKYKRAFEILEELLSLCKDVSLNGEVDFYTLYFTGELPYECYKHLTKDEYELLEELMKDEEKL
jgi:hypothetical protein